jgi:two-component system alkaline phosphatase synthesis response regulator PhoP
MVKILVAEDEPDIRELVAISLTTLGGFQVIEAKNGVEAVEKARTEVPDLILLDVRMPQMTGYEACTRLKEIPETRDIPIVFLSAKGQEKEIQQGLKLGAEEYILKPFAPDDLTNQVHGILRRVKRM